VRRKRTDENAKNLNLDSTAFHVILIFNRRMGHDIWSSREIEIKIQGQMERVGIFNWIKTSLNAPIILAKSI